MVGTRRPYLYFSTWLTDLCVTLIVFSVSRGLAESQASLLKMGVLGAVFSFLHAVSSMFFGRFSDRVGRPLIIGVGVALLTALATGCLVLEPHRPAYLVSYAAIGLAIGMIYPAMVAWINSAFHKPQQISKGIIRFCVAWNLGIVAGQLTGGFLFPIGRKLAILVAICVALVDLGVVLIAALSRQIDHSNGQHATVLDTDAQRLAPSLSLSSLFARLNWIANLGCAFCLSMILHLFPKLAFSLNVPSAQHGTLLAAMRGVIIALFFALHFTRFWHCRLTYPLLAQLIAVGGLSLLYTARGPGGLLAGLLGLGVFVGYNYFAGLFYSNTSSQSEARGRFSGIHEGTLGLGIAVGSLLGGVMGTVAGVKAPYLLGALVVVCLALVQVGVYLRFRYVQAIRVACVHTR